MRSLLTWLLICGIACCATAALFTTAAAQNPLAPKAQTARPSAGTLRGADNALELLFDTDANADRGIAGNRLTLTSDGQEHLLQRQDPATGGEPHPAGVPGSLPAWLVPGARVTYWGGSASIPGVSSHLVQDDNGKWVDPRTGQKYSDQTTRGGGGMGYMQLDIVSVSRTAIAVDFHNYLLTDLQHGNCSSSSNSGFVGNGEGLGDYWVHPAKLAKMQDAKAGGTCIMRMPYVLDGHTYKAISITTDTASGFVRSAYDLDTGLCLATSSSTVGANVQVANPNGIATPGAGTAMITSTHFLGVRQLHLPWANGAMPDWLLRGGTFDYSGTYRTLIPGTPELQPWRLHATVIAKPQEGFATTKVSTRLDMGAMPQNSSVDRIAGASMIGGLFVDPRALRGLEVNQTIDQDPITKVRTFFAGVQNGVGLVVEESALDLTRYGYDMKNGRLVGFESRKKNGVATTIMSVRLVTGR